MHMRCSTYFKSAGTCRPATAVKSLRNMQGSGYGSDRGKQQPPRLIIPGVNPESTPGPGGLILPGTGPDSNKPPGSADPVNPASDAPTVRNFRPPPGFMDAVGGPEAEVDASPQEMLLRLQAQAGLWHQLARLLPALQRKGYDATAVEEATGLERKVQNIWTSAASIYSSLQKSGEVSPSVLAHYDSPGGEFLLHELRYLSTRQRIAAVGYIAENNIDQPDCVVLARSIKEHERRSGKKEGFSESPADCLAYKYYRDAQECRREEDVEACVKKALQVVETETARNKLESLLGDFVSALRPEGPKPVLTILRLTKDEVGCRPIALAGTFGTVTASSLKKAPKVASEGVFATFTVPSDGATIPWVPLPAWSVVALAGRPVAIELKNCADLKALREFSGVKSDDDLKKLQGPGVLVMDVEPETSMVKNDGYYAIAVDGDAVEIVSGEKISNAQSVLGPVIFLCRPPARDSIGATTPELLSL